MPVWKMRQELNDYFRKKNEFFMLHKLMALEDKDIRALYNLIFELESHEFAE